MGLESFITEDKSSKGTQSGNSSADGTFQTDLTGRLLADGGEAPNPQISLKEYLR